MKQIALQNAREHPAHAYGTIAMREVQEERTEAGEYSISLAQGHSARLFSCEVER